MKKEQIIAKVESLLKNAGFTQNDYIISLQGPTVIMTQTGSEKIKGDADLRVDIIQSGALIMD
jgi:hypothetical protein